MPDFFTDQRWWEGRKQGKNHNIFVNVSQNGKYQAGGWVNSFLLQSFHRWREMGVSPATSMNKDAVASCDSGSPNVSFCARLQAAPLPAQGPEGCQSWALVPRELTTGFSVRARPSGQESLGFPGGDSDKEHSC